ncbi:GNAT family N-acetyltransferase [Microbulbifer sp. GL-2]|uniref:GNAT family N-acetyltransferase n=1 Tax=Microbulbifer sp. GL-2 TaxID=2591606 RepID=UPI0011643367|nr:GNAT family N-acetyltransferase [Microbulbifer sp. GL-2]BBM01639.1 putative N-acetyltransferase YsnE [Microbulbifer sp. GL-2]
MKIVVQKDDLSDGSISALLESHLKEMYQHSPPESVHALKPNSLKDSTITFWAARINGVIAGCGALKEISTSLGEIKSMKTNQLFLRKGVARAILEEILQEAKLRNYNEVKLETGSSEPFTPAVALYRQYGFKPCSSFSNYKEDPHSLFFTKTI